MGRARKSLAQKLLRAVESPYFEVPRSWHVLSRYRTAELFLKHPSPPAVKYTDTDLYRRLLQSNPQVKLQPLRINSTQPSLATRFVAEQQQLMRKDEQEQLEMQRQRVQQGLLREAQPLPQKSRQQLRNDAFRVAESKLKRELEDAGRETSIGGYLEFIQEQEEEALQTAVRKLKEQEAALQSS